MKKTSDQRITFALICHQCDDEKFITISRDRLRHHIYMTHGYTNVNRMNDDLLVTSSIANGKQENHKFVSNGTKPEPISNEKSSKQNQEKNISQQDTDL